MWPVSIFSSIEAMGDATATQVGRRPRKKLPARQAEIVFSAIERRRSHPRRYRIAAKTIAKVSEAASSHDCDMVCILITGRSLVSPAPLRAPHRGKHRA